MKNFIIATTLRGSTFIALNWDNIKLFYDFLKKLLC